MRTATAGAVTDTMDGCAIQWAVAPADRGGGPSRDARPASARGAILIIEPDTELASQLGPRLERAGYQVCVKADASAGPGVLDEYKPDALILDMAVAGSGGIQLLSHFRALEARAPLIALSGAAVGAGAIEAIAAGAFFLVKALALDAVPMLLEKAFGEQRRDRALDYYRQRDAQRSGLQDLIGESTPMLRLKTKIQLLLDAEALARPGMSPAVLVQGESGTGKERVARALHFDGARRGQAFIRLDSAAAAASNAETWLFGHECGAFAGARERIRGLLEAADGGTLFIDEIGGTPPALQRRLLDLLEQGTMRRIGGSRDIPVNMRVVAASQLPVQALEREGRLRSDLCRRLNATPLQLPPLRERGDDLMLLADQFVKSYAEQYGKPAPRLSDPACSALARHFWPGNVRELRSALKRAVWLESSGVIESQHVAMTAITPRAATGVAPELDLRQIERDALLNALRRTHGNVSRAAGLLGVSRDTLRYRIAKHDLARHMTGRHFGAPPP